MKKCKLLSEEIIKRIAQKQLDKRKFEFRSKKVEETDKEATILDDY